MASCDAQARARKHMPNGDDSSDEAPDFAPSGGQGRRRQKRSNGDSLMDGAGAEEDPVYIQAAEQVGAWPLCNQWLTKHMAA